MIVDSLRVLSISSPFFIQKLERWVLWEVVRLHCRMTGGRGGGGIPWWVSGGVGRITCSEECILGSAEGEIMWREEEDEMELEGRERGWG